MTLTSQHQRTIGTDELNDSYSNNDSNGNDPRLSYSAITFSTRPVDNRTTPAVGPASTAATFESSNQRTMQALVRAGLLPRAGDDYTRVVMNTKSFVPSTTDNSIAAPSFRGPLGSGKYAGAGELSSSENETNSGGVNISTGFTKLSSDA